MDLQIAKSAGTAAGPNHSQDASSDEEDAEDSSSSSLNQQSVENALTIFRNNWKSELRNSSKNQQKLSTEAKRRGVGNDESTQEDIVETAKVLFLRGVELEKSGKLYEAIQFYRRAVQLVPDIEFRLDDVSKKKSKERNTTTTDDLADIYTPDDEQYKIEDDSSDEDITDKDLLLHIQKKMSKCELFCAPKLEQKTMHISQLPVEIILYIFRWVVSSDLDLRSLEMCSMVCRGFYLCSRDSEIWRLACVRTWGLNCGNLPSIYSSWRQMFLERARLHFNGCYISKTTYIRHGENSFQDQFYRPWHLVAYYRYLRFFPEGVVLMMTTAEEPVHCVSQLKSRSVKSPSVLTGYYRLKDDRVTLVVQRQETYKNSSQLYKRNRKRDNMHEAGEQTFHMELQIQSLNRRRHVQLVWTRYTVFTRTVKGEESSCSFDLATSRFPPLWFSRVKSYTAESDSPLQ